MRWLVDNCLITTRSCTDITRTQIPVAHRLVHQRLTAFPLLATWRSSRNLQVVVCRSAG